MAKTRTAEEFDQAVDPPAEEQEEARTERALPAGRRRREEVVPTRTFTKIAFGDQELKEGRGGIHIDKGESVFGYFHGIMKPEGWDGEQALLLVYDPDTGEQQGLHWMNCTVELKGFLERLEEGADIEVQYLGKTAGPRKGTTMNRFKVYRLS